VIARLAASPAELFGDEPFINKLLKGFSLSAKLHVWRKLGDVVLRIIESGEVDSSMLPIFGGIAPAFMLRLNARLDVTIDESMQQKLQENPLVAPLLMDANTLVEATSGISNDNDALEDHLNHLKFPEPVIDLIKVLIQDLQDELTVTVVHPQVGL